MGVSAQLERPHQMAATSGKARTAPVPIWLYPQVLSLDAPLVAASWQWLFAKSFHVTLSPFVLGLTAACVWMIYIADHVLDVRGGLVCSTRHRFVRKHTRLIML